MRSIGATAAMFTADQEKMRGLGLTTLGAVVTYDVVLRDVKRGDIRAVFAEAGYGPLARANIPSPSKETALSSAVGQIKTVGMAVLQQSASEGAMVEYGVWRGDPLAKSAGQEKPRLGARIRVRHDGSNSKIEVLPPEGMIFPIPARGDGNYSAEETAVNAGMRVAHQIQSRAEKIFACCETSDVTGALKAVLATMHGAQMSAHGRGTLLLARYLDKWHDLLDRLAPFGVTPTTLAIFDLPGHIEAARSAAKDSFSEKITDLRQRCADLAAKSGKGKNGPRTSSVQKGLDECLALVNEANLYAKILGDLQSAVNKDVEAVKGVFNRLLSGGSVTYTDADVKAPLLGGEPEPPTVETVTEADGSVTKVIPAEAEASA